LHRLLVLWDIDGTLVSCGPVAREALEKGAASAAGLSEVPSVVMGGKTDPQIVAEILATAGVDADRARALVPRALAAAEAELEATRGRLATEGRVHPGVEELLRALDDTGGVRQTLVTGNVAPNAVVKVSAFGLDRYLDTEVGAYGSDHADRNQLVEICLDRVAALRNEVWPRRSVWVIGDTAHDLACARAARVRCLIVGTGREGFGAVAGLDADAVLEDLSDTDRVLDLLLG